MNAFLFSNYFFYLLYCVDDIANLEESKFWLKIHTGPAPKVMELWKKTANFRLAYIHSENGPTLNDVLQQWPRYRDDGNLVLNCSLCCYIIHTTHSIFTF